MTKHVLVLFIFLALISCSQDENSIPFDGDIPESVTDIDGNVYQTVVIGNQVWMAENLRTTRYNDGSYVYSENYFVWPNGTDENKIPYGGLYTWYQASSGKLAPVGWRVATSSDFEQLQKTLGGYKLAGGKMKCHIDGVWNSPNDLNESDSGFNAYPAGDAEYDLVYGYYFHGLGRDAVWWSSDLSGDTKLAFGITAESQDIIDYYITTNSNCYSIRCVME